LFHSTVTVIVCVCVSWDNTQLPSDSTQVKQYMGHWSKSKHKHDQHM